MAFPLGRERGSDERGGRVLFSYDRTRTASLELDAPNNDSAAGSFGLSFGLAFAGSILLATLSFTFTNLAQDSTVLRPAEQAQVAAALEDDAELMSNTQLEQQLEGKPQRVQDEIIDINTEARPRALQVALGARRPVPRACATAPRPSRRRTRVAIRWVPGRHRRSS
jgi:hypothetical protein